VGVAEVLSTFLPWYENSHINYYPSIFSFKASRFGTRASVPYNLSKAGVDMLTKSMALELGPFNIRVNSCNPGIIMTELARQWMAAGEGAALKEKLIMRTPLQRIAEIGEVVNAIIFLLSDVAPMIHGQHLFVDGGFSAA
jgi:L-xylulose reductase